MHLLIAREAGRLLLALCAVWKLHQVEKKRPCNPLINQLIIYSSSIKWENIFYGKNLFKQWKENFKTSYGIVLLLISLAVILSYLKYLKNKVFSLTEASNIFTPNMGNIKREINTFNLYHFFYYKHLPPNCLVNRIYKAQKQCVKNCLS